MAAALLSPILLIAVMQDFSEALSQVGCPKNFRQEQNRPARVFMFRDCQKCALKDGISSELFGAGKKPGINFRVDGTQFRLQSRRIAFRVVHQKTWIDAEEPRQKLARCVCQMGPGATLDLREIGLAQTAADLDPHRSGQFLLSHGTAQATEGTFDSAEGTEFVAKFHGGLTYCNLQISYYISLFCQEKNCACFQQLTDTIRIGCLFWLAEGLQVDSQLLALLVKVTALEAQCPSCIRHMEIVASNFAKHRFPFECLGALGERAR